MAAPAARPTIIDTDPGIDDAVAILFALAAGEFEVRGITTLAGNIGIEATTRNAGRILALAGRPDIPVFAGAARPLERQSPHGIDIHGTDGLGGVAFPPPVRPAEPKDAVAWLADTLAGAPAGTIDVLALGPLTNIAALVRARPDAAKRIGRLIAMGGAVEERGNVGPRAEFNLATDPEAAAIVLAAGLPLTLIPLDVTRRVRADRAWTAALATAGNPSARAAAALVEAYFASTAGAGTSRPLHDPCVMLQAIQPDLFGVRKLPLRVVVDDGPDAGAIVEDSAGVPVDVAMTVDAPAALALLADRLATAQAGASSLSTRAVQ